jgi:PHD/YefM family antitoxin component YafN of YafNO toxin-antitoxin module
MRMSFMTSAVFNQNPSRAKKQADRQPLVITDHGEASYVLVRYSDFQVHWRKSKRLLDALRDRNATADKDFQPDRVDFGDRDVKF